MENRPVQPRSMESDGRVPPRQDSLRNQYFQKKQKEYRRRLRSERLVLLEELTRLQDRCSNLPATFSATMACSLGKLTRRSFKKRAERPRRSKSIYETLLMPKRR
ncbi:hypothetical protein Ae201684P_012860 [Aphanomyces euteiches]|uniref:Uncharacterized protein n=1 Tax=Aphanomyces euteiches TaxID=100861 RepID=A0A6G0XGK5_9STRA|nr:hypothetical protein Ae201684_005163 [Aphanomyces euteiches]KAH9080720.1 hypothetical protein Ae201684P_012860 [Aphanomyces euteiches]